MPIVGMYLSALDISSACSDALHGFGLICLKLQLHPLAAFSRNIMGLIRLMVCWPYAGCTYSIVTVSWLLCRSYVNTQKVLLR